MKCPVVATQCPEKPGQRTGTGHARAYTQPGQCPVPVGVPFCLGDVPVENPDVSFLDVPDRKSHRQAVWRHLDGEFDIALFRLNTEWVTAWVMHRSRRFGTGSWRVAWCKAEERFAKTSEFRDMGVRQPHLAALVRQRVLAVLEYRAALLLAPARAFAHPTEGA